MKKVLLSVVALTACGGVNSNVDSTLPELRADKPASIYVPIDADTLGFVQGVHEYYDGYIPYTDEGLKELGLSWCEALRAGMTGTGVSQRIAEGAIDNDDAMLHLVVVNVAVATLCRDMADQLKGESNNG